MINAEEPDEASWDFETVVEEQAEPIPAVDCANHLIATVLQEVTPDNIMQYGENA